MCFQVKVVEGADWVTLPFEIEVDAESSPVLKSGNPEVYRAEYEDEISYDINFPSTDYNFRLFGSILGTSSFNSKRIKLKIVASMQGVIMDVDTMIVARNGNYTDGRIDVLVYKEASWVKGARNKKLKTIDLGQYVHTQGTIRAVNNEGAKYVDGGSFIRFPLDTLRYEFRNFVVASEQRPYVFATYLLKKGFAEIGWRLESPFLESEYGRRILTYIIADDYNEVFKSDGLNMSMASKQMVVLSGKQDDIFSFLTSTNAYWINGRYSEPVWCDIAVEFEFTSISPFTGDYEMICSQNGKVLYIHSGFIEKNVVSAEAFQLNDIVVNERDQLKIDLKFTANSNVEVKFTNISFKTTKVHKKFMAPGSEYKLNEIIQKDDTLLDYFYGIASLMFGHVEVDYQKRTLRLLTPNNFNDTVNDIQGYFKGEVSTAFRGKVLNGSFEIVDDVRETKRYTRLKFKDSDEYINKQFSLVPAGTENYSLHGGYIDFGDEYADDQPDVIDNKYFEPTLFATFFGTFGVNHVIGSLNGRMKDVGRRILFSIGVNHEFKAYSYISTPGFYEQKTRFYAKDAVLEHPFYAAQGFFPFQYDLPTTDVFLHLSFMKINPEVKPPIPAYTWRHKNIYELLIAKFLKGKVSSSRVKVDVLMTPSMYSLLDIRKQHVFSYGTYNVVSYIESFDGYRPCGDKTASFVFVKPDATMKNPEVLLVPENSLLPPASEDFDIEVNKTGCTYLITTNGGVGA